MTLTSWPASDFTCVCQQRQKREGHLFFLRHAGVVLLVIAQVLYVPDVPSFCFKLNSHKDLEDTDAEIHIQNKSEIVTLTVFRGVSQEE